MELDVKKARRERRIADALQDPQVRATLGEPGIAARLREPGLELGAIVDTVLSGYADRIALGERAFDAGADGDGARGLLPEFRTITYGELGARVRALAAVWARSGAVGTGDFVCTLGFSSADYVTIDLACVRLGAVAVPLQAGAPAAQWMSILDETRPRVLAVSVDALDAAVTAVTTGVAPGRLLVFDQAPGDRTHRAAVDSARTRLADAGIDIAVDLLGEIVERGRELPDAPAPDFGDEDPLSLLIYTSGSTGTPKGAMYTRRLVAAFWAAYELRVPAITLNYMPLSHVAGRLTLYGTLARGGAAYFTARPDMSSLFEDYALVRPTELVFVPRVCEMVHQRRLDAIERRVLAGDDRPDAVEAVEAELREQVFGGRYLTALSASAPLSAELKAVLESALEVQVHDGYGSTEAGGGVLMDNRIRRPPVLDYRLADVPELGYFGTDTPHPRGELLIKTTTMFPGYYRRPEITAQMFDDDGFYRTGDVVAELEPDHLVYVDRRNNVLKLSQGEFVTVATVEAALGASELIRQIFVYGNGERSYLLAVIVPTPAAAELDPIELRAALADSLQRCATRAELEPYELPREFLIESEPFTQENGLLSGIGKLLRPKLTERYGARLEALYTESARRRDDELLALRRTVADQPVLDTVRRAAGAVLGCPAAELRPDARFADLGGDSLSALSYSSLLGELFGIEVPVALIVGPTADLAAVAEFVAAAGYSGRPTARTIHGPGEKLRAADLTLGRFIDADTLRAAPGCPPVPAGPARTVLLTGGNGYLGRFLLLEWLERLRDSGGTLICLVRGTDAAAARARLDAVFAGGDPDLARTYRELSDGRLRVLAGDVDAPCLGLPEADWCALAASVDLIVHSAALVNHVLPYSQLFGPNVLGTAEVIRLALTTRLTPVTYLSTVAVGTGADPDRFTEDADIREVSAVRVVDDSYANGYGNSKWAGEVLLREAHDLCGLPVAVFRSDMILAHSRYIGQLNLPDIFTRLLLSILATGIAPKSFYRSSSRGLRPHYAGLPADFTAAAITALGPHAGAGLATYDVLNPHDDGIALDEFVTWLMDSGERIERIDDYDEWLTRFESALRALPDRLRRHSVLPLLHAYRHRTPPVDLTATATRFRAAVRAAGLTPDADIPHLTPALITKYAADLRVLGLL
ncbi:carboxylic acid reductase [Nocardia sp. NPDC057668]|uniref:carboxylic acid reductase n=1 Tax=Nocardia sp. NPDC057668 TaxID=3346202 RepID=UPI00366B0DF9